MKKLLATTLTIISLAVALQTRATAQVGSDSFLGAPVLTGTNITTAVTDISAFTAEAGEPSVRASGNATKSAWWKITPTTTGPLVVRTLSDFATTNVDHVSDTVLGIFTGVAIDALTKITFDDDFGVNSERNSRVIFNATAGTTYYINASPFSANSNGTVQLQVRQPIPGVGAWRDVWQVTDPTGASGKLGYFGTINFTTTARGLISGKVTNGKTTQSFIGNATPDGYFTVSTPIPGAPDAFPLAFTIDLAPTSTGRLDVLVDNSVDEFSFSAVRMIAFPSGSNSADAGYYTARITEPVGTGFLTVSVSPRGKVAARGRGSDGFMLKLTGTIAGDPAGTTHRVPLYQFAPASGRLFLTNLTFTTGSAKNELSSSGGFSARAANPNTVFLTAGFAGGSSELGARYIKPIVGARAGDLLTASAGIGQLNVSTVTGEITGFSEPLTLSTNNLFTFGSATRVPKLTVNTKTGLITGSFVEPAGTPRKVFGVVLARTSPAAAGYVTGTKQFPSFTITP